jgi:hypothetical protein
MSMKRDQLLDLESDPCWPAAYPPLSSQTPKELKETLSALAVDPDIPISKKQLEEVLQDPSFATELAAAEAELEAELASAEVNG